MLAHAGGAALAALVAVIRIRVFGDAVAAADSVWEGIAWAGAGDLGTAALRRRKLLRDVLGHGFGFPGCGYWFMSSIVTADRPAQPARIWGNPGDLLARFHPLPRLYRMPIRGDDCCVACSVLLLPSRPVATFRRCWPSLCRACRLRSAGAALSGSAGPGCRVCCLPRCRGIDKA